MVTKIMANRGFVRSHSLPFVMDNLGATLQKYDPDKWSNLKYSCRTRRFQMPIPATAEFEISVEPDYDADWSWCGEFTDRWEPGAIFHSNDPKVYKYFVPENKPQDTYRYYHRVGYAKQVAWEKAWEQARQDYKLMCQEIQYVVCVKLKLGDKIIGQEYVGGVFLDIYGNAPADLLDDMKYNLCLEFKHFFSPAYGYA